MCKYIILEDFKMDKYIYDDKNGLWYELQGDYYIPCLTLPTEKEKSIGLWGDSTNVICRDTRDHFIPCY